MLVLEMASQSATGPQTQQSQEKLQTIKALEELASRLKNILGSLAGSITVDKKSMAINIEVDKSKLLDVAKILRGLGFEHVKSLTGVDHMELGIIELVIHVGSYRKGLRRFMVILRTKLDRKDPRAPTLVNIWPSSEFQEREAWEMFGIVFEGHPDLRRLLLPEEFEGLWPGRRDFAIVTRKAGEVEEPWK